MAKKSLYLFLTSLLGVLLFLILHRVVFFVYVYMLAQGITTTDMSYYQFLAWEYFSLVICLMLGAWYGIWLGLYWFQKVYEDRTHGGLVHHISTHYFLPKSTGMASKMDEVKLRLESNLYQLQDIAENAAAPLQNEFEPKPIKRRVVRKRAPKKIM